MIPLKHSNPNRCYDQQKKGNTLIYTGLQADLWRHTHLRKEEN